MKKSHFYPLVLFLVAFPLLFGVACSGPAPGPIGQAEQTWAAQRIGNYGIVVETLEGSSQKVQTHYITVVDGTVTDSFATCESPNGDECEITPFQGETLTVEGLFRTAKLNVDNPGTVLTFDEALGYPAEIEVDDPAVVGDEITWRVIQFAETQ